MEPFVTDNPFDIRNLAADHGAIPGRFCNEELEQPLV